MVCDINATSVGTPNKRSFVLCFFALLFNRTDKRLLTRPTAYTKPSLN